MTSYIKTSLSSLFEFLMYFEGFYQTLVLLGHFMAKRLQFPPKKIILSHPNNKPLQKQHLLKRQTEEVDDVTPKIKKQKVPKNLSELMKNTYAGKCLLAAKGKNGKQEEEVEDPKESHEKEKHTQRMMDTVEVDDDKDSPKKTVTKRRMDPVKGVIKSKVGFMKVAGEDDEVKEVEEEPKTKKRSEKKKSPKEYLRQIIKSKVGNRCS